MNTRIEVGIIRNQNDEAFWLGANVGITESVSHIPTQITEYEGINAPLTNWEYSFFKGYLLRSGIKKTNRVCIHITDHVKPIKVGSVTGYVYIQNCQSYDTNCRFILLDSNKKKIDRQGNKLPDGDKSCFGTRFSSDFFCEFPSGQYYYREIRISESKLIEDDIPFTVVDSDDVQYVYIDHEPNLFKMYYKGVFSEEDAFPDLSKYYKDIDTSTDVLSSYYYINSNSLSFTHKYTMKPLWRTSYDITGVEFNGKNVESLFNFGWIDGIKHLPDYDNSRSRITAVKIGDKQGTVDINKSGSLTEDRYCIYNSYGLQQNLAYTMLPKYMYMEYLPTDQQYQSEAETYYAMEYPKYECDIKWDDLVQVVELNDLWQQIPIGYNIYHNHISGIACTSYDANVDIVKNTHFIIERLSMIKTTLKNETQIETHLWDGTLENTSTISGGQSTTYPSTATLTPPIDALKSIGSTAAQAYFKDNCIQSLPSLQTLFYYESDNGDIEACGRYSSHINDSGNPTIADEKISRAFIGTSIVYEQIKQGYEDYNF